MLSIKEKAISDYKSIEADVKKCLKKDKSVKKKLSELNQQLEQRQSDQQEILLERIRDKAHEGVYTKTLKKCEADIEKIQSEIKSISDYEATIKKRKAEIQESVDIIEQIVAEGAISNTNLRLLVDKIIISEKDKKLNIKINLNAKFEPHKNSYDEDGNLTERMFLA